MGQRLSKWWGAWESAFATQQAKRENMADVFVDISKKLAKMAKTDPGIARMQADAIGLGGIFDDIVKGDFPKELERSARFARALWQRD